MEQKSNNALRVREKTIIDGVFAKYVLKYIFKLLFAVTGWTAGPAPQISAVTIGAPHTSNWDFIYGIGAAIILDVKVYFSIKQSWCAIPVIGRLIMYMGAIPIDRSTPGKGQVEQISNFVQKMKGQRIYFAFTPEGTRSKVSKWKTGFYHVAEDCDLPINLGQLDYINKVVGIFHTFEVTGDKDHDVKVIEEAYKLIHGCNTEKQYPAYSGLVPELSQTQTLIMKTLYQISKPATLVEIETVLSDHDHELGAELFEDLMEKEILTKVEHGDASAYQLTYKGKGCLLHCFACLSDRVA